MTAEQFRNALFRRWWLIVTCALCAGIGALGEQARQWVRAHHDRDALAERLEALYTETRAQLGEAAFTRAYGAGQAMTIEQAAGYALEKMPTLPAAATPSAPAAVAGGRPDAAS